MPIPDEATINLAIQYLSVGAAPFMLFVSLIGAYIRISASRTLKKEERFAQRAHQLAPELLSDTSVPYADAIDRLLAETELQYRAQTNIFGRLFDSLFTQKTDWEDFRAKLQPWLSSSQGALTTENFRSAVHAARRGTRSLTHVLGFVPIEGGSQFVGALPGILFLLGVFVSCLGIAAAIPTLATQLAASPMDMAPLNNFAQTVSWFFGPAALGLGLFVVLSAVNLLFPIGLRAHTLREELGGILSFVWNNQYAHNTSPTKSVAPPEKTTNEESRTYEANPHPQAQTYTHTPQASLMPSSIGNALADQIELAEAKHDTQTPAADHSVDTETETEIETMASTDNLMDDSNDLPAENEAVVESAPESPAENQPLVDETNDESLDTPIEVEQKNDLTAKTETLSAEVDDDTSDSTPKSESEDEEAWHVTSPMPDQTAYNGVDASTDTHESREAMEEFPEAEIDGPLRPPHVALAGNPLGESFPHQATGTPDLEDDVETQNAPDDDAQEASNAMASILEQLEQSQSDSDTNESEEPNENTVTHVGVALDSEESQGTDEYIEKEEQTNTEVPPPQITAESMQDILDQIEVRRAQREGTAPADFPESPAVDEDDDMSATQAAEDAANVLWGSTDSGDADANTEEQENSHRHLPQPPAPLWGQGSKTGNKPSTSAGEPPAEETTPIPTSDGSPLGDARMRLREVEMQIQQAYEDKISGKITSALWLQMHTQWAIEKEKLLKEIADLEKAA